jgi:hypothetical protein
MPFDNSPNPILLDVPITPKIKNTLAALGLQPVPREQAEQHKADMLAGYAATSENQRKQVRYGTVYWQTAKINNLASLARPPDYSSVDRRGAPSEVIDLAKTVQRGLQNAQFQLEYFYTDPILNVIYMDATGVKHRDCLAIWDKGKVLAIANGEIKPRWHFGMLHAALIAIGLATVIGAFV